VTLSTIHRVKGREWDVVVLVGLRAGLIPHRLCDDVEEERRVLHVALTRARQHLVLVTDPQRPSPFLPELLGTIRPAHARGTDEAELLEALTVWRDAERPRTASRRSSSRTTARSPSSHADVRATAPACAPATASVRRRLARYGDELLRSSTTGP
jgi:hypothetical protein